MNANAMAAAGGERSKDDRIAAMEQDLAEIRDEIRQGFPALRAENDRLRARVEELEGGLDDRWAPVRWAMTGDWVDDMRQVVEQRLGVEAGDPSVIDDPAYQAVLDADRALEAVRVQIAEAVAGAEAAR